MTVAEATTPGEKSHELRRELNLRDVVLTQIVYVVGITWVGTAAKLGRSQIVFWLAARLLFYLPQARWGCVVWVVLLLLRRRARGGVLPPPTAGVPLEGGLYQWAKIGLGDAAGY